MMAIFKIGDIVTHKYKIYDKVLGEDRELTRKVVIRDILYTTEPNKWSVKIYYVDALPVLWSDSLYIPKQTGESCFCIEARAGIGTPYESFDKIYQLESNT